MKLTRKQKILRVLRSQVKKLVIGFVVDFECSHGGIDLSMSRLGRLLAKLFYTCEASVPFYSN